MSRSKDMSLSSKLAHKVVSNPEGKGWGGTGTVVGADLFSGAAGVIQSENIWIVC